MFAYTTMFHCICMYIYTYECIYTMEYVYYILFILSSINGCFCWFDILVASMSWLFKESFNEHWGACIFSNQVFSWYMSWNGIAAPAAAAASVMSYSVQHHRTCAAAHQAPPSLGVSRQEYWSGLPFPSPEEWVPIIVLVHMECIR